MSNALNAKVTGGTYHGGTIVTVECPKMEQDESGVGFSPCEAEIEVNIPYYVGKPTFLLPKCPGCDTVFAENDLVREAIIAAAIKAEENYDPTPWCGYCGSKTRRGCDCGPIARND